MPASSVPVNSSAPVRSPLLVLIVGWLLPGGGHFVLRRRGRAVLIFVTVAAAFLVGLAMRGPMFQASASGDLLSRLIQYGGFLGDLATGAFYFLATWLGYAPPDQAGHAPDYGSKFIVAAGLLNILAMVDAYEIATHQKD